MVRRPRPIQSTADDLSGEDALASHIAAQESARAELRARHRNNRGRALVEDELATLETDGVANGRGVDQADFEEIIIPEAPQTPGTFTAMAEVHQRYRESLGPSIDDFKSMHGIEQALETLPPDSQTRIRNFYARIRAAYVELWDEDPNRTPMSSQEVSELFGPEEASVVLENMDELQSERILSFFHSFERVFNRKNSSLGPQLPNLAEYLDRVSQTPDSPSKLVSDDPENADVSCAMCLTEYQPSDTVVPLPCGSSHHFHRNCAEVSNASHLSPTLVQTPSADSTNLLFCFSIQGWLVAQPQCPVCRTPIEIRREYSNTTYDGPILTQA
ncbi:hypothetical protein PSHT_12125 [Puccinia striiformis]|uniref:RING-type domain-containing protein n=1 Tax=Puccinia striiformis TaxID=27350 RepID=A0A2S4UYP2_9BASI|nr:hypothetical protein PSHT_12125 [Puccinia striiformis]